MSQALSPAAILSDLVSFKTISRTPNLPMIEYLEVWAAKLGFSCARIKHPDDHNRTNLLCWIGPQVAGGLMLSAHTDVVPVAEQDWFSDPFKLREQDGKLFARGSADMKGFIAATCAGLQKFDFNKLARPLSLLFSYDEETGCEGSHQAALVLKDYLAYMPESALIGEPTNFEIYRMHAGHVTVSIKAFGKGAHSSNPDLGISAIKALHQVLGEIFVFEEELKHKPSSYKNFCKPYVFFNIGVISGGTAVNIIPAYASATIGFRPLPDTSVEKIIEGLEQITQRVSKLTDAEIKIEIEQMALPVVTPAGTKFEKILELYARSSAVKAAAFCTDAGNLSQVGISCLIFGPGSIALAHQPNEFINKVDLELAAKKIPQIVAQYLT
jgi:acetylornithine deacetylase